MANEIELLMTLDPLDLTDPDLVKMVLYERRMRAMADAGVKPQKQQLSSIEGSAILTKLKMIKPPPTVKRRV